MEQYHNLEVLLKERKVPLLSGEEDQMGSREEKRKGWIHLLCSDEYGWLPPSPEKLTWEETVVKEDFLAGKAPLKRVELTAVLETGNFTFPVYSVIPKKWDGRLVVLMNFRDHVPDEYLPSEEICDQGCGVLSFCYQDVTTDDGDFSNGLAGALHADRSQGNAPGKLMMWAWAAMRVLDYGLTIPGASADKTAVAGHSRLGKAALLAGGLDKRFACVYANESGCSGAAVSRGKQGETVRAICDKFPFWFCPAYRKYADREDALPFDQHMLLALTAPRRLYVGSAAEDLWADPDSEYLGCAAASPEWELYGEKGFVCEDRLPKAGDVFHGGKIGYHLREGRHYLSREDWIKFLDFFRTEP